MQAVILAGGVGSRLDSLTQGKPKCLAEIGGRPLILHQLEALADYGAGPVLIVVGHRQELIREVVEARAEYIVNERYRETNSLYSLWLAREWVQGPFLLLNSDLFFDPEILARVLEEPRSLLAYDSTSSRGREQTKVVIRERRVVDLGKDLPLSSARGESLGLLKFDAEGAQALFAATAELLQQGAEQAWAIEGTRAACRTVNIYGVNVAGLPWVEIDFPYDLEQARKVVWPAIWKGRWRRAVYWKRTQWAAAGLVVAVVAQVGWFASTRVGPASVDWESVPPLAAPRVTLRLPDRTQNWWLLSGSDTLVARVDGGAALRLEFRLLLAPGSVDTARYAVATSVDGGPVGVEAFTATLDSGAVFEDAVVSDRARLELTAPAGQPTVRVTLAAGQPGRLLVRVRQPE